MEHGFCLNIVPQPGLVHGAPSQVLGHVWVWMVEVGEGTVAPRVGSGDSGGMVGKLETQLVPSLFHHIFPGSCGVPSSKGLQVAVKRGCGSLDLGLLNVADIWFSRSEGG